MNETTKTLLIVGAVAIVGYVVYSKLTKGKLTASPLVNSGVGQNIQQVHSGASDASFWDTLGNVGKGLNDATSAVESTYNNVYNLFGGQPTTQNTGQGNNGTLG